MAPNPPESERPRSRARARPARSPLLNLRIMDIKRLAELAWLNLVHDKRRLAVSAAGVSFAVVLMAMELGFRFALLDSMVELIRLLDTDLVIISRGKETLVARVPF